MSVLVVCPGRDPEEWVKALEKNHPGLNIYVYPEDHDKEKVDFAITWNHPRGLFKNYPNLKVIASMGAGVDHITSDAALPENVKITRVVDEQLTKDMSDFVLSLVMKNLRGLNTYFENQADKKWDRFIYKRPENVKVGIMGMGVLGKFVAQKLYKNNFKVSGWSKSSKQIENILTYHGKEQMEEFLNNSEILICLLPLTPDTENILNATLFEKLPKDAYVINVARGQHLVEHDLIKMIDNGHLAGAALDVFREEPLPEEHPFWEHKKISVTPHVASVTHPQSVVPQIVKNYERMKEREPLKNEVALEIGY